MKNKSIVEKKDMRGPSAADRLTTIANTYWKRMDNDSDEYNEALSLAKSICADIREGRDSRAYKGFGTLSSMMGEKLGLVNSIEPLFGYVKLSKEPYELADIMLEPVMETLANNMDEKFIGATTGSKRLKEEDEEADSSNTIDINDIELRIDEGICSVSYFDDDDHRVHTVTEGFDLEIIDDMSDIYDRIDKGLDKLTDDDVKFILSKEPEFSNIDTDDIYISPSDLRPSRYPWDDEEYPTEPEENLASGIEAVLELIAYLKKFKNEKFIGASTGSKRLKEEDDMEDNGYIINAYYDNNCNGLADIGKESDVERAIELIWEYLTKGEYVIVGHTDKDGSVGFTPDEVQDGDDPHEYIMSKLRSIEDEYLYQEEEEPEDDGGDWVEAGVYDVDPFGDIDEEYITEGTVNDNNTSKTIVVGNNAWIDFLDDIEQHEDVRNHFKRDGVDPQEKIIRLDNGMTVCAEYPRQDGVDYNNTVEAADGYALAKRFGEFGDKEGEEIYGKYAYGGGEDDFSTDAYKIGSRLKDTGQGIHESLKKWVVYCDEYGERGTARRMVESYDNKKKALRIAETLGSDYNFEYGICSRNEWLAEGTMNSTNGNTNIWFSKMAKANANEAQDIYQDVTGNGVDGGQPFKIRERRLNDAVVGICDMMSYNWNHRASTKQKVTKEFMLQCFNRYAHSYGIKETLRLFGIEAEVIDSK